MASSRGDYEPGCSRKRARKQKDVELIDLEDMELEQNPQSLFPNHEEPSPPAWAKKRTNMWVKDATQFLRLEPNNVGADDSFDIATESHVDAHMQQVEFRVNIPLHRMLYSFAEYRENCVICYHKSRALQDEDMEQWMLSDAALRVAVEQAWPLGQGFFAVKFGSKSAADEALLNGEMPFNEGHVHVVPYIPCFFPSEEAKQTWPVWVSFPRLPLFLKPFLQDIASGLGKVLHVLQPSCMISSVSPRVCILWDARKEAPNNVNVSFDQLGTMKLAVEFDTIGVPVEAPQGHENGAERGAITEPLPLLLPGNNETGEDRTENLKALPLLLPALASNEKELLLSPQKGKLCVSAPSPHLVKGPEPAIFHPLKETKGVSATSPHAVKGPELAIAHPSKEIKGPIITSPVSTLLGKGMPKYPTVNPIQITHSLSSGTCLMADQYGAQWGLGREARTTYDNALYQHKKNKTSGKELAVAPRHHAMKEVSSNTQVKHSTDSKRNAPKNAHIYAGNKENNGTRKDPKYDKENSVTRKDSKDEEKSVNKRVQNGSSFQSPEALTSSPNPYYLSPLPYCTPPS